MIGELLIMNRSIILKKLQKIFHDVFEDDTIILNENTNPFDIEAWDSLTHISILAAIQDEFSVSFDMSEIIAMKNIGDILNAIEGKLK